MSIALNCDLGVDLLLPGEKDIKLDNSTSSPAPDMTIEKPPVDEEIKHHAEVVLDLAIQMAKDQLSSQFSAYGSLDGKLATILGFTAVFAALILGTKWHKLILIPMIPAFLTVLLCLFGLLYGKYRAGPDPKEFYESNYSTDEISAKQALLSELQASLSENRDLGVNKSTWLLYSVVGVASTVVAVTVLYLFVGGG